MTTLIDRLRSSRGWWFDLSVCGVGIALFVQASVGALRDGSGLNAVAFLGIPLILVIARFPVVIDIQDGGIEVGFDSCVLMFLLCTLDAHDALVVWSLGVLLTQLTTAKRLSSKIFNIGVGITAGFLASAVLGLVRGEALGTPRELAAVAAAAAVYFAADFVVSAFSLAISGATTLRDQVLQPGTLLAIGCFVPFDTLGYLGAVVHRSAPPWTLVLLAVPLTTLLVATRALTRGRENARRLAVLFDAAVRAQTLSQRGAVAHALLGDARKLLRLQQVALRSDPPVSGEVGAEIHDGDTQLWIVAKAMDRARSTVTADEQALKTLAAVATDAFARLTLTSEMVHVARHDPLTDLPNRGILLDRIDHALSRARRRDGLVALLFVDLDGFKPVNDRFGHAAGDAVLIEVAGRLRACVRGADTVARLGGDEFAILFEDTDTAHVEAACERVLRAVREGAWVAGHRVPLSASAGIAYAASRDDGEGLLGKADLAMYAAKAEGKDRLVRYEDAIGHSRLERLVMVEDLRRAIAEKRIDVVYQPVVATGTGRIVGVEALARWTRDGVAVPADVFIRVAEDAGMIVDLGDVALSAVAADAATLRGSLDGSITMCVNVSAQQLMDPTFVDRVRRATVAMAGVTLVLEITEREGIDLDPVVLASMHAIADMGVSFAIDDFGVGFSSISYLTNLPVRILKADASLSEGIDTDERASALLRSVTQMGQSLGLDVIVEGIERESQMAAIGSAEGLYVQGYLLHRPMSFEQLRRVLSEDRSTSAAGLKPSAPASVRSR
ncbi:MULTISPECIES: putative bifunctional diguanylate cyclase/phosphodiesterase [Nocardioides]|uniref:Bifunctional diguanylate cyclase/phosphodiesterase n=1 Tax=Nocardioides vastitatis TaxID=2568655 RepID=A0ABW0ZCC4_9ACTN|nr:EAL domain-containing protein [Nocardioides sp.]THI97923.1 EAL domain-containing protein [Nocardioides sp.]